MIDLYSDTVTKPTAGMYRAMTEAELGDDQRGDDHTARALEERVATLLGQPAALILPTATMANQIAIVLQCRPGAEVICHRSAHVYNFEAGGVAANAGAQVFALDGPRGTFTSGDLERAVRPRDPHFSRSSLVVVENTSNVGGGTIWPDDAFENVVACCKRLGLSLHVDGARLFNAAVARNRSPSWWSSRADSAQLCFSKGLGCPFGATLAGSKDLIEAAKDVRQRLGGALRQAGVMAGAMNYALDHHVDRLSEDHERLERIASALAKLDVLELQPYETNILYFSHRSIDAATFAARLAEHGVWVSQVAGRLRLCTHLGIDDDATKRAIALIGAAACKTR
jgi:threonine aldolase